MRMLYLAWAIKYYSSLAIIDRLKILKNRVIETLEKQKLSGGKKLNMNKIYGFISSPHTYNTDEPK